MFNIQYFDSSKTYLSEDTSMANSGTYTTMSPANAKYMVVTCLIQYESNFMMKVKESVSDVANTDLLIRHNISKADSLVKNSGQLVPYEVITSPNTSAAYDTKKTRYLKKSARFGITKGSNNAKSELNFHLQYGIDTNSNFGFWFYADKTVIDKFPHLAVYFHNGSRNTSAIWKAFYPVNGWNFFRVAKSECTVVGTAPDYVNYVSILVEPQAEVGESIGNVWVDAFFDGYKLKPTIAIGYDGMWSASNDNGVYTWHMTNNIPCNIGFTDFDSENSTSFNSAYSTLHPIAVKMANQYGFEMGAYGGYGDNAGEVRRATDVDHCRELIYGNVNALNNDIDAPITFYVLSQGVNTVIIEKACKLNGIKVIRTTRGRPIMGFAKEQTIINCFALYEQASVSAIKDIVDNIIANGYCGMFFTHAVVAENPTQYQTLYSDWSEVMTYIKGKVESGDLNVMNVSEMVEKIREEF